jgi:uncharacterized protein
MMLQKYTDWLFKNPKAIYGIWAIILLLTLPGLAQLWINSDYRSNFAADNPQLLDMEKMQEYFPSDDNLVIAVHAPNDQHIFTKDTLKTITELTNELSSLPHFLQVHSITNYNYIENTNDEIVIKQPLLNPESLSNETLKKWQEIYIKEPALKNRLLSQSGNATVICATFSLPKQATESMHLIHQKAKQIIEKANAKNTNLDFYLSGTITGNESFMEATRADLMTLIPVSYALIFLIIFFFVGSWYNLLVVYLSLTISILITLGIKGWFYPGITANDAFAPTAIMIIAVSDFIHIFDGIMHQKSLHKNQALAVSKAVQINFIPIVMTNVTTAIGMFCLNFNESPTISAFGNLVGLGVFVAMLLSLTLVPHLLSRDTTFHAEPKAAPYLKSFMNFLIQYIPKNNPIKNTFIVLIMIVSCFGMGLNTWQDEITKAFDQSFDFRKANDFINREITGLHQLDFALLTPKERGIVEYDFMHVAENFEHWLKEQKDVVHTDSIVTPIKRIQELLDTPSADEPQTTENALTNLSSKKNAISQYLLVYELSLPAGVSLNDKITQTWNGIRIQVRLKETDTASILAIEQKSREWFLQRTQQISGATVQETKMSTNASSTQASSTNAATTNANESQTPIEMSVASIDLMFAHIVQSNIYGLMMGTFAGFVMIGFLMMFMLQSPLIGLIAIISNLWPICIGYGLWGFTYGQLGLSAAAVGSVSLGIVVDDTIHVLHRFMHHLRQSPERSPAIIQQAIVQSVSEVGPAMIITALVFSLGFSVLIFSNYIPTRIFGSLTGLTISVAVIVDLLLIPRLIINLSTMSKTSIIKYLWK